MKFVPKKAKEKDPSSYKTLYIKDSLIKEIEQIAKENDTSFNNVVISMIETCLKMNPANMTGPAATASPQATRLKWKAVRLAAMSTAEEVNRAMPTRTKALSAAAAR